MNIYRYYHTKYDLQYLPAVNIVKTICNESKKKNIINREMEAPMGKAIACDDSIV